MAAFEGYLIKVNGTVFPNSLLAPEGYSCTPNIRTDKDSYTDGKGTTHRHILPVQRSTLNIKTIDGLTQGQLQIVQAFFIPRDKIALTYWNNEKNAYKTTDVYVPDVKYTVKFLDKKQQPHYSALELEFIAYGDDQ